MDDLVKRLREVESNHSGWGYAAIAADRIEELEDKLATCEKYRDAYAECARIGAQDVFGLETKLAECEARLEKAVDALDEAVYLLRPDEKDMMRQAGVYRIVTTLAELKGQKDE